MNARFSTSLWLFILTAMAWIGMANPASARVTGEAIPGQPFGVGQITMPVAAGQEDAERLADMVTVAEQDGRVLYPAVATAPVRRLLGELLGNGGQSSTDAVTVLFLFTGAKPLKLTVSTSEVQTLALTPRPGVARAYDRLLRRWWREYHAATRQQAREGDYPPLVETYLTSMLARRLQLQPPLLSRLAEEQSGQGRQTLELLLGLESYRLAILADTMAGGADLQETADQPLPPGIAWPPLVVPPPAADLAVEAIAAHVPEECFYIRFGKFSNYLWMSRLLEDYGGEIRSMMTLRGHSANLNQRMQRQLALKQSVLAEVLGDQVISDVAILGRDTYVREGAAIGILFEARNGLLTTSINGERSAALARHRKEGAKLETVNVNGREVSFLSTPDNRLRSYYAVDGNYHLVTTSRAIVQRFYAAGQGERALASLDEFRHARTVLPLSREDTIFCYFSTPFARGLVGPEYQIEVARRIRSVTDIELLKLARLTARGENRDVHRIEDLVSAGLLPPGFGRRPDGSRLIDTDDGVRDSHRGARGSFTPVPDVAVTTVSRREQTRYAARVAYYESQWRQLDPLMVAVKRFALNDKGLERIVIDAHISPLDDTKYQWLTASLGPPTRQQITSAPDDIISIQAALRGGLVSPTVPPHLLFVGIQDNLPLTDLRPDGLLKTLRILQSTPGYLGGWPKPGFLDMLPLGLGGVPDTVGFSPLPLGLWRRQGGDFSVLSFDRDLLARVSPHLRVEETGQLAQIRARVGDLSQAKLAAWVNSLSYQRAREASVGNSRLLHAMSQQLHVPPAEAIATAEELLDANLLCTLGGSYELVDQRGSLSHWRSTAWPQPGTPQPPDSYTAPVLEWFRGLEAALTKYDDRLVVHAQVDMQRKESAPSVLLPLFNLFNGSSSAEKKAKADPPAPPAKTRGREF